jgi:hypothetical protein
LRHVCVTWGGFAERTASFALLIVARGKGEQTLADASGCRAQNFCRTLNLAARNNALRAAVYVILFQGHFELLVGTGSSYPERFGYLLRAVLYPLGQPEVYPAGMTAHPDQGWMEHQARNVSMEKWGFVAPWRYLLHDRDRKFCASFRQIIETGGITTASVAGEEPEHPNCFYSETFQVPKLLRRIGLPPYPSQFRL